MMCKEEVLTFIVPRRGRGGGPSKAKTTRGTNKSNIPLRVPTQPVPTQPVPTRPVPIDTAPLAINANTIRPGPQSQRAIPSHPPSRIPTIATPISPSSPAPHITVAPPQPSPAVEAAGNMCRLELLVQEVDSQRLKLESQRVEMEEYMHAQEKINKTQDENYARMFEAAQDQAQTFQKENQRMVRENTSLRTQVRHPHFTHFFLFDPNKPVDCRASQAERHPPSSTPNPCTASQPRDGRPSPPLFSNATQV